MKFVLLILFLLLATVKSFSQDSLKNKPAEYFTSGFIDVMNNGQVNASARLVKINIGEPDKFSVPISFYGGVSSNNFQNTNGVTAGGILNKSNDHLVNQYINPLSGLINISFDKIVYFKKYSELTKFGYLYQVGERILTGVRVGAITNPQTGKQINFLNSYATAGLIFQTGAWEKNNAQNIGIFWLALRYHATKTNPKQIKEFLPDISTNGLYTGYSIGFGIEIDNSVNIKTIYYKYTKAPEIEYGLPIYQFTFNYTMNKK